MLHNVVKLLELQVIKLSSSCVSRELRPWSIFLLVMLPRPQTSRLRPRPRPNNLSKTKTETEKFRDLKFKTKTEIEKFLQKYSPFLKISKTIIFLKNNIRLHFK